MVGLKSAKPKKANDTNIFLASLNWWIALAWTTSLLRQFEAQENATFVLAVW